MWSLIEVAIEPKTKADQERLGMALKVLAAEDPTLRISTDHESGQTIVGGMSELQLDIKLDILKRTYKVEANIGAPQVAYRETLGRRAEIDYTHKKQTGGSGQFARIKVTFEPTEAGAGYLFSSEIYDRQLPGAYVLAVEKGLYYAKADGLLAGFPVVDFRATLIDGGYHDLDSSVRAFEIAARAAFRELRQRGSPKLLEPIMTVEIAAPEDSWREVVGWLHSRHADVHSVETGGTKTAVVAIAPLAKTFGLWRMLIGVGIHFDEFRVDLAHYAAVPTWSDDDPDSFPPATALRA